MDNIVEIIALVGLLIPLCIGFWYELVHVVFIGKPSRFDIELEKLFRREGK